MSNEVTDTSVLHRRTYTDEDESSSVLVDTTRGFATFQTFQTTRVNGSHTVVGPMTCLTKDQGLDLVLQLLTWIGRQP